MSESKSLNEKESLEEKETKDYTPKEIKEIKNHPRKDNGEEPGDNKKPEKKLIMKRIRTKVQYPEKKKKLKRRKKINFLTIILKEKIFLMKRSKNKRKTKSTKNPKKLELKKRQIKRKKLKKLRIKMIKQIIKKKNQMRVQTKINLIKKKNPKITNI